MLDPIQRTIDAKWPLAPRLIAGFPLALSGLAHLVGVTPVGPLIAAADLPAADLLALAAPIVEVLAGGMLIFGWLTRVGGVLGALVMAGAVTVHFLIPDDRWPQPVSGIPGPEPLFPFLLAWLVLGCSVLAAIRGGGLLSIDRRQVANRAASRGGGLDAAPAPRVKRAKPKKGQITPPADGESVW